MESRKNLESWMIQKASKEGFGLRYICKTYGCTEEQLLDKIRIFFKKNSDRVISQLKANDKRLAKRAKKNKNVSKSKANVIPKDDDVKKDSELEPKTELDPEEEAEKNLTEAGSTVNVAEPKAFTKEGGAESIQQLEVEETKRSNKIVAMEFTRSNLRGKYQNNLDKLQEIDDTIALLEAEFDRKCQQAQVIIAENAKLKSQIDDLQRGIKTEAKLLADLRKKLRSMRKIELCVFHDGTIGLLDDTKDVKLDTSGSEVLFRELMEKPECLDLKTRDVLALARLTKILESLKSQELEVEIYFDDAEVERVFYILSADVK